ncbi:MAG: hypothetical protein ABW252_08795 [Polyangiales bacterium]
MLYAMDLTGLDLPEKRVLRALFELARRDHPARPEVVARALDLDVSMVAHALGALAQMQLADAARVRLTLAGLAAAVHVAALPRGAWSFLDGEGDVDARDGDACGMCDLET